MSKSRENVVMSRCFTRFPFGGLVELKIYHQSICFTRMWDFDLRDFGDRVFIVIF